MNELNDIEDHIVMNMRVDINKIYPKSPHYSAETNKSIFVIRTDGCNTVFLEELTGEALHIPLFAHVCSCCVEQY